MPLRPPSHSPIALNSRAITTTATHEMTKSLAVVGRSKGRTADLLRWRLTKTQAPRGKREGGSERRINGIAVLSNLLMTGTETVTVREPLRETRIVGIMTRRGTRTGTVEGKTGNEMVEGAGEKAERRSSTAPPIIPGVGGEALLPEEMASTREVLGGEVIKVVAMVDAIIRRAMDKDKAPLIGLWQSEWAYRELLILIPVRSLRNNHFLFGSSTAIARLVSASGLRCGCFLDHGKQLTCVAHILSLPRRHTSFYFQHSLPFLSILYIIAGTILFYPFYLVNIADPPAFIDVRPQFRHMYHSHPVHRCRFSRFPNFLAVVFFLIMALCVSLSLSCCP
jgi:hypothetical protein